MYLLKSFPACFAVSSINLHLLSNSALFTAKFPVASELLWQIGISVISTLLTVSFLNFSSFIHSGYCSQNPHNSLYRFPEIPYFSRFRFLLFKLIPPYIGLFIISACAIPPFSIAIASCVNPSAASSCSLFPICTNISSSSIASLYSCDCKSSSKNTKC